MAAGTRISITRISITVIFRNSTIRSSRSRPLLGCPRRGHAAKRDAALALRAGIDKPASMGPRTIVRGNARPVVMKARGLTMRVLIAVSTTESAISGRKPSIRSRASAGRPKRG